MSRTPPEFLPPAPAPPPPPAPAPPRRRFPSGLVVLLVLALLAAGVAGVARLDRGGDGGDGDGGDLASGAPAAQRKDFDELMAQVAELRGLQWKEPLNLQVVTKDELGKRVRAAIARDSDPVQVAAEEATLKVLGLVPESLDYAKLIEDLLVEQIVGFYDPETRELFVGSAGEGGDLDTFTRYVIAHEMTHALTDQVFTYGPATIALDKADKSEEYSAYSALLEGDAVLLQDLWAERYLSARDQLSVKLGNGGETGVLSRTPEYIQQSLYFPYGDGRAFVKQLYDAGGFAAVDAAYRRPPRSTEQILHPETYASGEGSAPPALPDLAVTGCRTLRAGTLGQFDMQAVLDSHLTSTEAGLAVAGWNGDAYGLVRCGNALGLADRWETDPGTDPGALVNALARWAGQWSGGKAAGADGRFSGPNGSGRIVRTGSRVDLVLGRDAATAAKLLDALGAG